MAKKDVPASPSKAGAKLGFKLKDIPDDCVPFGDGKHLWSPSEKALYNAEGMRDLWIEEAETP